MNEQGLVSNNILIISSCKYGIHTKNYDLLHNLHILMTFTFTLSESPHFTFVYWQEWPSSHACRGSNLEGIRNRRYNTCFLNTI